MRWQRIQNGSGEGRKEFSAAETRHIEGPFRQYKAHRDPRLPTHRGYFPGAMSVRKLYRHWSVKLQARAPAPLLRSSATVSELINLLGMIFSLEKAGRNNLPSSAGLLREPNEIIYSSCLL